jgi:hypothetical protein
VGTTDSNALGCTLGWLLGTNRRSIDGDVVDNAYGNALGWLLGNEVESLDGCAGDWVVGKLLGRVEGCAEGLEFVCIEGCPLGDDDSCNDCCIDG